MGAARDITGHFFSATDQLLFDTTVWLDLYGPQSSPAKQRTRSYSGALKDLLLVGSKVYIDVLVMAEFVNRYARLEYQCLAADRRPGEFRDFRDSPEFEPIAQAIAAACRKIAEHCERTESEFSALDLPALLSDFEGGASDFNDLVLAALCRSRGLTLVTHDAHFAGMGLPILTANAKMLKPSC